MSARLEFGTFHVPAAITHSSGEHINPDTFSMKIFGGPDKKFRIELASTGATDQRIEIPLKIYDGPVSTPYLMVSLIPQESPDTFMLQLQCGNKMATARFMVAE